MSSIKCPECNLTNWATASNCKRCRYDLQAGFAGEFAPAQNASFDEAANFQPPEFSSGEYQSNNQPQWTPPDFQAQEIATPFNQNQNYQQGKPPREYQPYDRRQNYQQAHCAQPANLKSGLATASMVLAILGFVTSIILIGIPIALLGLVLGIVALVKANKKPQIYGGKGFAIAGVAVGSLAMMFFPIIAAIAIPNILASRRAANEASAIAAIRTLSSAEVTYMSTAGGGKRCADLQTLGAQRLIDSTVAGGERFGYRFMVVNLPTVEGGCELRASPVSSSTGTRSFYFSTEDGLIRANKTGKIADRTDAPIE